MSIQQQTIRAYKHGTYNIDSDEIIPKDAATDSLNWRTQFDLIELVGGRQTIGGAGLAGKNYGEWTAYKANGTAVRFRKVQGTIQVLVGSTWTNVITGLTVAADYVAAPYSSLAGTFVYFFGVDGIYKVCTANPTSYASMYDSSKNFKGYAFIDKGRSILWGRTLDPTGLYGSFIDAQNSTVYTTVSGEATTSLAGTLGFKSGHLTRTCFGVTITLTGSGEVYTDNFNGVLTGTLGGTGTINYMTGDYTLSTAGVGTATYQWEDSNLKGVTDFTHSATRLAGEGFVIRQDVGGDAIVVVLPLAGSYFSLKAHSAYQFTLDATDLAPVNIVFRTDIGVPSLRSVTATGKGIIFINTGNPSQPTIQRLQQNVLGDNFDVTPIFKHFDFSLFDFSDAVLDNWDRYLIVGCKLDNAENDTLLLGDIENDTVDRTGYGIRSSCKVNGVLYGGDPLSQTTYELFTGNDDLGIAIQNNWDGNGETFGADVLKKVKRRRIKGLITPTQVVEVYESYDDGDFALIGTILGNESYVDYGSGYSLGQEIGRDSIGGTVMPQIYNFFIEIKVRGIKFRKRKVRFVAKGIGYVAISQFTDFDIWTYQEKMPSRYRLKQNVPLSGEPVDSANPDY